MFVLNAPQPGADSPEGPGSPVDPLGTLFLLRLERLLWLRRATRDQLNIGGACLLDLAIYSTYCDLHELRRDREAYALVAEYREPRVDRDGA